MPNVKDYYSMGYVYPSAGGKGRLKSIKTDYELWCHVSVKAKTMGVQVDRKSKDFKLPFELKSFVTTRTETVVKNVTENVIGNNANSSFYDNTLDDKLGGRKEILGW